MTSQAQGDRRPWAWIALAVATVLGGLLLIPACGLHTPFGTVNLWCSARAEPALDRRFADLSSLKARVNELEESLADPARCKVEPKPEVKKAEAPQPPPLPPCPPGRKAKPPRSVLVLMDRSRSMDLPSALAGERARRIEQDQTVFGRALIERLMTEGAGSPNSRLAAAKSALSQTVKRAPSGLPITFMSFAGENCNTPATRHGSFSDKERGRLIQSIQGISSGGGTPLAAALESAGAAIEGGDSKDDPATILLVSDGADSCNRDVCAVARALKARKPGLVINVVDMSGWTNIRCVAEITGGFVRSANERLDLPKAMRESAGIEGEGQCRPQ